ncbi:Tom37 C-terminal domain-containing protein [Dactylonectria macrodidyma]|uniref:Tom37 C-terminal domain-containing protein n=1 Tax=Dactylonectria macrodidyma TaxID=307937 RepID=A0A9P9JFP7_9HYPO|nr:Tom37 C-terminal domain-containing protein [Dactylonectria macrodidyma]
MLELHVWGSAFGLPSFDPECLALITFLQNSLPAAEWRLVPSNDPSISPSNTLPALHHDSAWTTGYWPIVNYLVTNSRCAELDASLTPIQHADRVAYGAFLAAHAAPLLDLSLYVSAANWSAATRPAFSALLPFPLTWTVPPLIRADAVKRVEHLGFADMDSDFDPNGGLHLTAGRDALPETFRRHLPARTTRTVHEEMTPEQAVAIRLHGVTEDCLSVLEDLMKSSGDEKPMTFFGTEKPTSLDCLAYGYLALMRDAPVPRSFLKDWIVAKAPRLSKFVDVMKSRSLASATSLPWAESQNATALRVGARTLDSIILNAPSIGEGYADEKRRRAEGGVTGVDGRTLMLAMSLVVTGAAMGFGLHFYKSLQPFGTRTQIWAAERNRTKLSQFGELGSILGGALGGYQPPRGGPGLSTSEHRFVETDSEVD